MNNLSREAILGIILSIALFTGIYFLLPEMEPKKELISFEQEKELGDKLIDLILKDEKKIKSGELYDLTDSIFQRLREFQDEQYRDIPYQMHLVKNAEVNAMALPGGHIVVYTGILKIMDHPDAFAGVVGHEMGHIAHRHIVDRLLTSVGVGALVTIIGGDPGLAHEAIHHLIHSAFSRKQETEADEFGYDLMIKSGFAPIYLSKLFAKFEEEIPTNDIPPILHSHPKHKDRITTAFSYPLPDDFEPAGFSQDRWLKLIDSL
ncbi:MAG: M48 family metallopeptidase [Cryomorphaceae bacterium]|nr:M48 family metallopeptidase [Cryomorphaceae bacterium]